MDAAQLLDQDLVGEQADPGHQGAEGDGRGRRHQGAQQGARGQRRSAGLTHGPQVVEAEDAVDAELLGPPGGGQCGVGLVAELREGDADLHAVVRGATGPPGDGRLPTGS